MTANVLKFGSPIRLVRLSADPVSAENGEFYYNSTVNLVGYYENGTWQQVASRTYAQSLSAGLDPKESVLAATVATLPAVTYNNGASGVGATLTGNVNGAIPALDGVTLVVGSRVLIKNQVAALQNGIYVLSDAGSVSTPFILTRSTDFDGSPSNEVTGGEYTFVKSGTQAGSGWVLIGITTAAVIGTDPLNFTQFSAAAATLQGAYIGGETITTSAGEGNVVIAGTEALQITSGGGILINQASTTNEGIDLTMTSATTNSGVRITQAGTGAGLYVAITNALGTLPAIDSNTSGTGMCLRAQITNAGSTSNAGYFYTQGFGNGIRVESALGGAASFVVGASSTGAAITIENAGTGPDLITPDATVSDNLHFKTGNGSVGNSGGILLETGSAVGIRGSAEVRALKFLRGKAAGQNIELEYFHTETLTAGSSNLAVPDFQFAFATYEGLKIDYKIKEAVSDAVRVGTLYIGTNGVATTVSDYFTENADVGVTWAVAIVGPNVEVRYTTTANNKIMRADVKRIRT